MFGRSTHRRCWLVVLALGLALLPATVAQAATAQRSTNRGSTYQGPTNQRATNHRASAHAAKVARSLRGHRHSRVCGVAEPGLAACQAVVDLNVAGPASATPAGYGPADLAAAYQLPAGPAGTGPLVAVVDAYDASTVTADLATYRAQYGLPPCGSGCFRKVNQSGGATLPPASASWGQETSLDVEMVSAACPNCRILLVEARSASMTDLGTALNTAVRLGAVAVSNSYGAPASADDKRYDSQFYNHPGVAITASTGDSGYGVNYPAASAYVTAVGGTSLVPDSSSRGWSEQAWGSTTAGPGGGSGCSAYDVKPSWQRDSGCRTRNVSDVAAVADPATGVAVYDSTPSSGVAGWLVFGGTSVSAPLIAGMYGLAGQSASGHGYPAADPYRSPTAFNDVTGGANGSCGTYLCTAVPGYDGPTGVGTPRGVSGFVGDCERAGVTCRPALSGSCSPDTSQATPPATIRVYVPSDTQTPIHTVDFRTYVQNVLPNEWVPSWDGDALKAGAIVVKSYAWYWATHFGGYLDGDATQCFDVTDDADFQVYQAGSSTARTNAVVNETWPFVARDAQGAVRQTSYRAYLNSPSEACGAYADGSTLSQYGSQACNEASTGNKWNVILQKYYSGVQLATAQQVRTPHDFTYAQTSTPATFNAGRWAIDDGYPTTFSFGLRGDLPAVLDSGDGFAHAAVYRPSNGTWYLATPTGTLQSSVRYGLNGDIPVAGHWNGRTSPTVLAVYRPSNRSWYVQGRSPVQYGLPGDIPVPGDYNGDGATEIAVFRPSNGSWYVQGRAPVQYGLRGDIPVPADYNGDGSTDVAVFRPSNQVWYIPGRSSQQWGLKGDIPVTGDYTGDGTDDVAVYRPGNHSWYVSGRAGTISFGSAGVTPIGAAPYRG